MDEDFFDSETPHQSEVKPQNVQSVNENQHHENDDFNFQNAQYQAPHLENHTSNHSHNSHNSNQYGSFSNLETSGGLDIETTNKIRQEEEKIQQKLSEKSNAEYELKNKRREEGKRQYEEFQNKKDEETATRKRENRSKQQEAIRKAANEEGSKNWKKVGENVQLKQSQNQGKKDITRMREAIINKKADQK